jgi:hypothetical protein
MQVIKRYTVDEILTQARTIVAPLACEPIWSRDHDRLGFLIRDEKARRGVRFAPMGLDVLEQDSQLSRVLSGIRSQILKKGFTLSE